MTRIASILTAAALAGLAGCATTESSRSLQVAKVEVAATPYKGAKVPVTIGKFDNRSSFMRGVFSDGVDRLGGQAKATLVAHLQQSMRFSVMDRDNLAEARQETQYQARAQAIRGAEYLVTGDISEFGRKEEIGRAHV